LIPINYLIDGVTLCEVTVAVVEYSYIELERHDIVLAEALPVESYLDTGNRASFSNGGPSAAMFPDFGARIWETMACAPLVVAGSQLASVRAMLHERAASYATPARSPVRPGL